MFWPPGFSWSKQTNAKIPTCITAASFACQQKETEDHIQYLSFSSAAFLKLIKLLCVQEGPRLCTGPTGQDLKMLPGLVVAWAILSFDCKAIHCSLLACLCFALGIPDVPLAAAPGSHGARGGSPQLYRAWLKGQQTVICDCIKMQVELVPGGRGWVVLALRAPCEDFGMLVACCEFLLPLCLRTAGAGWPYMPEGCWKGEYNNREKG